MKHLRTAVALAVLLPAQGMKGEEELEITPYVFGRWQQFGYYAGGALTMMQTVDNAAQLSNETRVWSLVCTSDQFDSLLNQDEIALCRQHVNMTNWCFAAALLGAGSFDSTYNETTYTSWSVSTIVPSDSFYQFLILSCEGGTPMQLDVTYHFVNPGGEELSSGAIPLKPITRSFSWIWGVMGACMLLNMGYVKLFSRQSPDARNVGALEASLGSALEPAVLSPIRTLHFALLGVVCLKTLSAVLANTLWQDVSRNGVVDSGMLWGNVAAADISSGCLIAVVMLLSRGWQVTRLSVERYELRHVIAMTTLYIFSWLCWQLLQQFFWLFLLVLCYVLLLRYLFASVSWRLRVLQGFRQFVAMLGYQRGLSPRSAQDAQRDATTSAPSPADFPYYTYADAPQATGAAASASDAVTAAGDGSSAHGAAISAHGAVNGYQTTALEEARQAESASLLALDAARERSVREQDARNASAPRGNLLWRGVQAVGGWWNSLGTSAESTNLTTRQIHVLVHFRTAVLVYLTLDVMSQVWSTLALEQHPWVGLLLTETWNASMMLYLCLRFRATTNPEKSVLYDPRQYTGATFEQLLDPTGERSGTGADRVAGTPQRLVIQNPDSTDASGKMIPSVVIAELADNASDARAMPPPRSPRPLRASSAGGVRRSPLLHHSSEDD